MNPFVPEPLKIVSIERETDIDWTFSFEYDSPLMYGQFFEISIPGIGEAPISVSDFDETRLFMTIRKVGKLTDKVFNCKPGDRLFFRGPYGNGFKLEPLKGRDLIIIAGGTGLAPVRGLIRHFINSPSECSSLNVITGFKSPSDILFRKDLDEWEKRSSLIVTVDKGDNSWTGKTGLVTEYIRHIPTVKSDNARAIVVGPPLMMKFATLELFKNGMNEEYITVSFERNMSCGIGKCGHCKIDETYVCLDGPVFNYSKARTLID